MIKKFCLTLTCILYFAISHGKNAQLTQSFTSGNFEECAKSDALLKKEANNPLRHFLKELL